MHKRSLDRFWLGLFMVLMTNDLAHSQSQIDPDPIRSWVHLRCQLFNEQNNPEDVPVLWASGAVVSLPVADVGGKKLVPMGLKQAQELCEKLPSKQSESTDKSTSQPGWSSVTPYLWDPLTEQRSLVGFDPNASVLPSKPKLKVGFLAALPLVLGISVGLFSLLFQPQFGELQKGVAPFLLAVALANSIVDGWDQFPTADIKTAVKTRSEGGWLDGVKRLIAWMTKSTSVKLPVVKLDKPQKAGNE